MSAVPAVGGVLTGLVLAVSVYTDLRHGKVFNKVVLPCVPLGLLVWGLADGWPGVVFSLSGTAVASIALIIAALPRWIAPGDAKLILAIGALTGAAFVGSTMVYGALVGGAMAIVYMARRRLLGAWARSALAAAASRLPANAACAERAGYMPYSVAIALGALVSAFAPLCGG